MAINWESVQKSLDSSAEVWLSRSIDNELNGDSYPTPQSSSDEAPRVNTSNDETGANKEAGTGQQLIAGVSNTVLIGGAIAVAGLIFFVVRS